MGARKESRTTGPVAAGLLPATNDRLRTPFVATTEHPKLKSSPDPREPAMTRGEFSGVTHGIVKSHGNFVFVQPLKVQAGRYETLTIGIRIGCNLSDLWVF